MKDEHTIAREMRRLARMEGHMESTAPGDHQPARKPWPNNTKRARRIRRFAELGHTPCEIAKLLRVSRQLIHYYSITYNIPMPDGDPSTVGPKIMRRQMRRRVAVDALTKQGLSKTQIASQLGVTRQTVAKDQRINEAHGLPTGAELRDGVWRLDRALKETNPTEE